MAPASYVVRVTDVADKNSVHKTTRMSTAELTNEVINIRLNNKGDDIPPYRV